MFLITHFSLKKKAFKNDKMRSHECLYFLFFIWNTVNQVFFFLLFTLLVIYDTLIKHGERAISY